MQYFDLHADTPEKYYRDGAFSEVGFHIYPGALPDHVRHTQIFAFWADNDLSDDEAYAAVLAMRRAWETAIPLFPQTRMLFSLEDMRVTANDISRLETLLPLFRVYTLLWEGNTCIGGGWNTEDGLTPFGKRVTELLLRAGKTVDISHSSDRTADEVAEICSSYGAPFIATHSCSRAVCPHKRNIPDPLLRKLIAAGGIIGVSFVCSHLREDGKATTADFLRHVEHMLSLGAEDHLCIGSDFDGTSRLPEGIAGLCDIPAIGDLLLRYYSPSVTEKILWKNADRFFFPKERTVSERIKK